MEVLEHKITKFTEGLNRTTLSFSEQSIVSAEATLANFDFPTTRNERWKYTRVTKISNKSFTQQNLSASNKYLANAENVLQFIFVNGVFDENQSSKNLPECLSFHLLSQAKNSLLGEIDKKNNNVFTALNTLYAQDGAFFSIKANTKIEQSIQIIHILTGKNAISNFRTLIVAEKSCEANFVQLFVTENADESFCNHVAEVVVGENAKIFIDKIQNEDGYNYHISNEFVQQSKNSNFKINTITLNGSLVRNDLFIDVNGENAETHLNGTYVLNGKQHVDNHTTVDHKVAHCESNELYKGVIDENATAVFNGKVFVRKDAQKINAYQSNGNVLLSDDASVNSKPELEIYADDVKCSHGSTTGQLDEEAIYYLRARGISEKSAKALMVTAFIGDVIEQVENEEIVDYIHQELHQRFGWEF